MLHKPMPSDSSQGILLERYLDCRRHSEKICEPLETEDFSIQSMPDVSPPKWHLAHTTWFFETFILLPYLDDYRLFHPEFPTLFNSYYQSIGRMHPRPERGNLARPSQQVVQNYRKTVDAAIVELVKNAPDEHQTKINELLEIGIQHEQQHQELLLMDIKYNFFKNPSYPTYLTLTDEAGNAEKLHPLQWLNLKEGLYHIGSPEGGFAYDNEKSRHRVFIEPVQIADRLITNCEYLEFIDDGGYERFEFWLAEGWDLIQREHIKHPLYWLKDRSQWLEFTLHGLQNLDPFRPVHHVSYFEADAFAKWKACRLPSEFEWEALAQQNKLEGQFLDFFDLRPANAKFTNSCHQLYGYAWEWTMSSYSPYPGFKAEHGALGEYNGKFMVNQYVLRGGSCLTPEGHVRPSYRNFFPSHSRWMVSGIRLAREE